MAEDVRHNQSAPGFGQERFRVAHGSAQNHGRSAPKSLGTSFGKTVDIALNSDTIARLRKRFRRWRRTLPTGNRQRHGTRPTAGHRIADQLRLIVAVPIVAVVAFAGLALITTAHEASRTGQPREQAT